MPTHFEASYYAPVIYIEVFAEHSCCLCIHTKSLVTNKFFNNFRRLPVLEETAADISKLTGNKVLPLQCDIRDPVAIKSAVDACVSEFGLPNVVVHNAAGKYR